MPRTLFTRFIADSTSFPLVQTRGEHELTRLEPIRFQFANRGLYASDLDSFDTDSGDFHFLFNPRKQLWTENFSLSEGQIIGQSPEGRNTARLPKIKTRDRSQKYLRPFPSFTGHKACALPKRPVPNE